MALSCGSLLYYEIDKSRHRVETHHAVCVGDKVGQWIDVIEVKLIVGSIYQIFNTADVGAGRSDSLPHFFDYFRVRFERRNF